jgi:NAD(P)-dependent dehydrogenase (short-subunit alcohol dehydrogenase family)
VEEADAGDPSTYDVYLEPACVLGITEAAADFLAPCGIRVNSLAPALVISPLMQSGDRIQYFKDAVEGYSMFPRRFTTPEEIASACLFLLENSMMNAFHVSGLQRKASSLAFKTFADGWILSCYLPIS